MSDQPTNEAAPLEGEVITNKKPTEKQIAATMDKVEGIVEKKKAAVIEAQGQAIMAVERVVQFNGKSLILVDRPYQHFVLLTHELFKKIYYTEIGGATRSAVSDVYDYVKSMAEDLSPHNHLIGFGQHLEDRVIEAETDLEAVVKNPPTVWDTRELIMNLSYDVHDTVWRSPYSKVSNMDAEGNHVRLPFIMQLAGGDEEVYDDIMQSLAPIIMEKKPDGVIWWVGNGANGKSTLMDAIYKIFPNQLASINVKRLTDGRDTPSLNGKLANIVKESSEGRVDDTEIYKALGTHENFRVHKFHSQEDAEIGGNIHTIFSANSIPTFNDKGYSARRRTFIIPFTERFISDPDFEKNTFTEEFFGKLILEMCAYANKLKRQGYRYKWSAKTRNAKETYDKEANNAEEYAAEIIAQGIVAFDSFAPLRIDYENWCATEGYTPLGIGNLKKAMNALGFERSSARTDGKVGHLYTLPDVGGSALEAIGMGRAGMFTTVGFRHDDPVEPEVPEFHEDELMEPPGEKKSVLKGKW